MGMSLLNRYVKSPEVASKAVLKRRRLLKINLRRAEKAVRLPQYFVLCCTFLCNGAGVTRSQSGRNSTRFILRLQSDEQTHGSNEMIS